MGAAKEYGGNLMKQVTSETHLSHLSIKGYKSIAECDMEMGALNVLIGANGAGKSNFISFFKLIATILDERLQSYVSKTGGPDTLLHFGRKTTEYLKVAVKCGDNGYGFRLEPTNDNRMMFDREALWWGPEGRPVARLGVLGEGVRQLRNPVVKVLVEDLARPYYTFQKGGALAVAERVDDLLQLLLGLPIRLLQGVGGVGGRVLQVRVDLRGGSQAPRVPCIYLHLDS